MSRERPGILVATSVVNIVVGLIAMGIGLLGISYFLNMQTQSNSVAASLLKAMDRAIPGWINIEMGKAGLVVLLGAGLVLASVGLLLSQSWARWYCILYGLLAILLHSGLLDVRIRLGQTRCSRLGNKPAESNTPSTPNESSGAGTSP
jgi:hypothetical protein